MKAQRKTWDESSELRCHLAKASDDPVGACVARMAHQRWCEKPVIHPASVNCFLTEPALQPSPFPSQLISRTVCQQYFTIPRGPEGLVTIALSTLRAAMSLPRGKDVQVTDTQDILLGSNQQSEGLQKSPEFSNGYSDEGTHHGLNINCPL